MGRKKKNVLHSKIILPLRTVYIHYCLICNKKEATSYNRQRRTCKDCEKDLIATWDSRVKRLFNKLGGQCKYCGYSDVRSIYFYPLLTRTAKSLTYQELLQRVAFPVCLNCKNIFHKKFDIKNPL